MNQVFSNNLITNCVKLLSFVMDISLKRKYNYDLSPLYSILNFVIEVAMTDVSLLSGYIHMYIHLMDSLSHPSCASTNIISCPKDNVSTPTYIQCQHPFTLLACCS